MGTGGGGDTREAAKSLRFVKNKRIPWEVYSEQKNRVVGGATSSLTPNSFQDYLDYHVLFFHC